MRFKNFTVKGFLQDSGTGSFEAVQEQRVLVDLLERLLEVEREGEVEEKWREATVEKGMASIGVGSCFSSFLSIQWNQNPENLLFYPLAIFGASQDHHTS